MWRFMFAAAGWLSVLGPQSPTLTYTVPAFQQGAACSLSDRQVTDSMFVCLFVQRQSRTFADSSAIVEHWPAKDWSLWWKRVAWEAEPVMLERTFTAKRGERDTLRAPQDSGLRWYHLRMANGRGLSSCWTYAGVE